MFAELAERLQLPALVGELVAGVALGLVLRTFHDTWPVLWNATQDEPFESIVGLGMFFLMLLAGIRMEPLNFARTSKSAIFVALGGMIVPLGAGVALGLVALPDSPLKLVQSLFLGTALAITAVPVAVRMFMDIGELESRVGQTVIAAALWDDLISLFLLAFLVSAMTGGDGIGLEGGQALRDAGKMALFFVITIPAGHFLFPLIGKYFRYLRFPEVDFSMLLIAALAYAIFAEKMGMHFIIGAFMAGMFFHPNSVEPRTYDRVEKQMSGITRGFLAPIFFVAVGLHLDFSALATIPGFVIILVVLALLSKFVGAGIPAYLVGLPRRESLMVGIGMSGRGAVELIVAGVALEAGLFLQPTPVPPVVHGMYSSIVVMALVTTIIAPIALHRLVRR